MSTPNVSPVHDRQRKAVRPHLPLRPLWLCRVCAAPWPCQPARLLLLLEYRRDRVGLSVYMAALLFEATGDLVRLSPNPEPSPTDLFDRFLAWTRRDSGRGGEAAAAPRDR
ncbi:hypothetical protein OOK41_05125 [Micromonospora sp. NBC_01655]|uniref:hypothetical protein n=1 Tax=Micromonospora sp. NBC_01655 TaxID=2975983 RepID=UPI00224C8BF7|nr:hypothetical protein [Micromonospora sp. NBC_01655]MCX4469686.1 hypothetical protein [Micromonospora sp. NBC_01655]